MTQAASGDTAARPAALPGEAGVAVDSAGNVYVANENTIQEWHAATKTLSTIVSSGLASPQAIAVDAVGDVYIAYTNTIKEWHVATNSLTTVVSSGLGNAIGVAVDGSGNVFIADSSDNTIDEWNAVSQSLSTLAIPSLSYPTGVAVDAAGNVYISDLGNGSSNAPGDQSSILEWNAASKTVSTLVSVATSTETIYGLSVDHAGDVYYVATESAQHYISSCQRHH